MSQGQGLIGDTSTGVAIRGTQEYVWPILNVMNFGGVGDGIADDTNAIQTAITQAQQNGGSTVYLPAGLYKITASLVIPSFVRLTGPGYPKHSSEITGGSPSAIGATIVGSGSFHMIVNSDVVNGNTGIEIDHLKISQPSAITGDYDIIRMTGVWRSSFHDLDLIGYATTHRYGINLITPSEENQICLNHFEGCGINSNSNALTISRNDIGGNLVGITLSGGFGHRVIDNHIYNASSQGISAASLTGCVISDNHIESCGGHGMSLAKAIVDCVITNNVVKNNSQTGGGSGIVLDSNTAASASINNVIANNQCFDNQGVHTQQYGIAVISGSGTQTNGNLIHGNSLHGNVVAGFVQGASLLNTARSNIGYNPIGVLGPPVVSGSTVAFTNPYPVDCMVNVNGGTVSDVAIGGSSTGRTSGPFMVAAGQTITLTYTVAPTWTWFGN